MDYNVISEWIEIECIICTEAIYIDKSDPDDILISGKLKILIPYFQFKNRGDKIGPLCGNCHQCLENLGIIE